MSLETGERARALARDLQSGDKQRAEAALGGLCAELRSGEVHLLNEYVSLSPLCAELFSLWEAQDSASEGGRIVALVIETLASVLEGKFEQGARTAKTKQGVAGRVLSERLQYLYRYFSTEKDQLLRACLRLLTGISSQSQALASQLLRTFNFTHEGFGRLVSRRSWAPKKGSDDVASSRVDVRTYCARFALSFLRWRDPALTASALSVKGLIGGVLRGIQDDPPQDTLVFLRDVLELVVRQRQLPRQVKVFFFNAFALRNLCGLLASDDLEVLTTAGELLSEVCCSPYIFRPHQRQLLLDMSLDLRPLHGPQQELVAAVLRSHPALQLQFCARLSLPLQPRLSRPWLLNVRFLSTLLAMDVSSLHSEAASHAGEGSSDQMAELRMTWLLGALVPKALQKTLISQALLHKNDFVLLAALQLLTAALDRVQRCVSRGHWEEAEREELLLRVQQNLPELNTLLLLWQRLSKESSPSALPSQEAAKRRRGAKRGGKEEGEGDGKAEGDGEEVSKEEDGNANAAEEVDEAEVMQLLELPPGGLESHVIFTAWCGAAQRYLEVLPRSALDVKFDWSKLLAAVAAPLLAATGHASSSGKKKRTLDTATGAAAFTKLLACSRCVGAAMRCGGRMEGMQLSKSQLSWAETLLRLRAAASSSQEPAAAELLSECGTSLQSCLRGLAVLGSEEDVELAAWLSQLCRQPGCAPFFCQALQAVASKPGSFVSLTTGFETARAEEHGRSALHKPSGMPSASLLLSAALRQLTRRDPQAIALQGDSKPEERQKQALLCAEFIGALVKQLATLLPQAAPEFASLVESIGSWTAGSAALQTPGPEEGQQKRPELSALSAEGNSGAEAVRQTLLIQLRGLCEMWKCQGDASKKPKKARDSSTEFAQVVQDAVQSLGLDEGKQDDEGVALAETSLAARTFQTVLTIQQSSPHGHCSMYVLLEGARASSRRQDFLATSWYLLSLASLAAALAPNQSKKGRASSDGSGCLPPLRYALAHPVWSDLVSSTSTSESEHSLCLALAFGALWRLLQASAELGLRGDKEASGCHDTLLLKLWRRAAEASSPATLQKSFGELLETSIAESFGDPVACWAANPTVALLANGVVSASRNASDLLERLGQELQELGTPIKLAVVEALLLDAEKGPAFLNLGVERRASLMRLLADTTLTGNKKAKQRAGQSLQKALALDRGGLLRMSLTSTGELPWPGSSEQGLSLGLVPLLEQACWVNPSLRREVVRQLEWGTSDPSAVLHMAAALAPFETTMPFLQDAAVKSIEPLALRPLPSDQRLCRLFELHPAPALEKLVRSAMGDTADEQGSKSKTISRLCFSLRLEQRRCRSGGSGRQPQLEQAILRYLDADHASDAVMASQSAMSVARALQDLGQVPSSALQQRLQSQIEALLAATETHEAAAILLWGLLPQRPAEAPARVPRPAAWQVSCAQKLLEEGDVSGPSGQPEWLLAHATRWWPHLLQGKRGVAQAAWQKKFVAQVRKAYKASLSMADRLRRQILIGYAAGDASIASADSTSSRSPVGADADSWSFRSWCELLLPWDGQPAPYEWDLDQQRLRATTDTFFFDRSMADPVPRVSQGRCVANEPKEQAVPDSGGKDEIDGEVATVTAAAGTEPRAYDIGYLVPFFAGQLRILGAEYSKGNENARRIVGPTVSALASGGGLELLLLACACSDETLRACAFEALSVVMLLVSYWNVDLLEEDTDEEDAEEAGVDDSKGGGKGKAGRGRGGRVLRRTQAPATGRLPFRELPELVRLLRYVRDAIRPPAEEGGLPAALPRLTVSFVSACVPVLLQPHHFLYMRLSKFMFGRPAADLEDTPLFYKLMLAGEPDSSQDARLWLIRVIRRALVLRGPTHKPGADKAAGGDKLTRLALARRYVVPWLLSFAGSRELGSFPVWTEAITCLVAALSAPGPAAVGSALSLSVAEWAAGQAERTWPGRQSQRLQALRALGRLVSILLRLPSRSEGRKRPANSGPGANGGPELLALGSAVEALVTAWASASEADAGGASSAAPTNGSVPLVLLWGMASRFAALVRELTSPSTSDDVQGSKAKKMKTEPDKDDDEDEESAKELEEEVESAPTGSGHHGCSGAELATLSAQLGTILQLLGKLCQRPGGDCSSRSDTVSGQVGAGGDMSGLATVIAKHPGRHSMLVEILGMLEACPFSAVLHELAVHFAQKLIAGEDADVDLRGDLSDDELMDEEELEMDSGDTLEKESLGRRRLRITLRTEELGAAGEEAAVRCLGRLVAVLTSGDGTDGAQELSALMQASLLRVVHVLAALPYRPSMVWRAQLLACAALLALRPEAASTVARAPEAQRLLARLPAPSAALDLGSRGAGAAGPGSGAPEKAPEEGASMEGSKLQKRWSAAAAELLGQLVLACDMAPEADAMHTQPTKKRAKR